MLLLSQKNFCYGKPRSLEYDYGKGLSMSADIDELVRNRLRNLSEFSRPSGVSYATFCDIANEKTAFEKIGISVFMEITHSLGMTAEELYYGKPMEGVA